jgi:hypothetical protein
LSDRKLVGYLIAGNDLQDLTGTAAADGGNWNDRIDQVSVAERLHMSRRPQLAR